MLLYETAMAGLPFTKLELKRKFPDPEDSTGRQRSPPAKIIEPVTGVLQKSNKRRNLMTAKVGQSLETSVANRGDDSGDESTKEPATKPDQHRDVR